MALTPEQFRLKLTGIMTTEGSSSSFLARTSPLRLKLTGIMTTEGALLWNTLGCGSLADVCERSLWNITLTISISIK